MRPSDFGTDLDFGYGVVSASRHGAEKSLQYPFTEGTVVPEQAAASYYNQSFVADGLYTSGLSPFGNGNPSDHVGQQYFTL
jgi:hypothetical protein